MLQGSCSLSLIDHIVLSVTQPDNNGPEGAGSLKDDAAAGI